MAAKMGEAHWTRKTFSSGRPRSSTVREIILLKSRGFKSHRSTLTALLRATEAGGCVLNRAAVRSQAEHSQTPGPQDAVALQNLSKLAGQLKHLCAEEKLETLRDLYQVKAFLDASPGVASILHRLSAEQQYAILSLPVMQQHHVLEALPQGAEETFLRLRRLADVIVQADGFYSSLGGILGYQAKCLELIQHSHHGLTPSMPGTCSDIQFFRPQGPHLDGLLGQQISAEEAAKGLEALPHMAEIWPLGGAGDRLGLKCQTTGKSIPTAMLPYCGRTLLEGLVRDLQARETLHYKLYGVQHVTPVVIMTSNAKDNHRMVTVTLEAFNWFGRGKENFRVICQPLVPVISARTGKWLLPDALSPMLKPGGHGALWKLMLDSGAFAWLNGLNRQAALVRQISNPMAGVDATMLALTGSGYTDGRIFGFASCERTPGAAEGINVLMQRRLLREDGSYEYAYNVTNVEYTEFERLGISDQQEEGSPHSVMPANTNVLYVSLKAVEAAVKASVATGGSAALPGMIFNSKKTVTWRDAVTGTEVTENAGRMECTMQNLVDSLAQRFQEPIPVERHAELNTFVVFNKRRKVTSSAKRKRKPGSSIISQTPDGSFLDLMRNAAELLQQCGIATPEVGCVEEYLEKGPTFIFLFNPALGPLWDVVAQKLRGGAIAKGSELILEVAEAAIVDLRLRGSLLIEAECVVGRSKALLAREGRSPQVSMPSIAGQAVRYQKSGSEAMQYSSLLPDLSETTSAVVPLPMRKLPQNVSALGEAEAPEAAELLEAASQRLEFSPKCARVRMCGVVVYNEGIQWDASENVYWQHKIKRREQVRIILRGQSEFEASHVVLIGSHTFEVPDGYKMVVSGAPGGAVRRALVPLAGRRPSWQWRYLAASRGGLALQMEDPASPLLEVPLSLRPADSEAPFTYVI